MHAQHLERLAVEQQFEHADLFISLLRARQAIAAGVAYFIGYLLSQQHALGEADWENLR